MLLGPLAALPLGAQTNVLLIVADDLGVDVLESYGVGADYPQTPNLDALANQGIRFENAWANPVCSTTRATLMTGRYSFRTGVGYVVEDDWALPLSELILPEALDLQGTNYSHAAFGKWHLGNASVGGASAPNMAGFSHYSGSLLNLKDYFAWNQTINGVTTPVTTYATSTTVAEAAAWIASAPQPWFCYLALHAPHAPYHAPPAHLHTVNLLEAGPPSVNPRPYYRAMVQAMDTEIGNLLEALQPLRQNTNVLFLGDNGTPAAVTVAPSLPAHAKGTVYQGGVRVPLIVQGPAVSQPGSTSDALVSTVDLFSTVLEMAGAAAPAGILLDSVSLLPYCADPSLSSLRRAGFTELFKPSGPGPYTSVRRAIRGDRFKLILNVPAYAPPEAAVAPIPSAPPLLFFDLSVDPMERTNLLDAPLPPQAHAAFTRLSAQLQNLVEN